MRKHFICLFFIYSSCWLLCSCHKDTVDLVMLPTQPPTSPPDPPATPSTPTRQIVNRDLRWTTNYVTKIASARLTRLEAPPSPNSADSILAVYIQKNNSYYEEVKRGVPGNSLIYYEIENNSIMLHKNNIHFIFDFPADFLSIPKTAMVDFR